ncbi:hypothetical protein GH714_030767 [Hevea brasiliensis]|uniref:Uncharacterized protein n=1 Tax=Hevea brasiliensis TaxID=3981 RepID=A0A6A6LEZ9_HEVBR|nr:hypothetical protein GH714_030767 [Hevea brasiliensis]
MKMQTAFERQIEQKVRLGERREGGENGGRAEDIEKELQRKTRAGLLALVVIPRSPTLCLPPRKLGFSSTFHRDSTLCISTSRVSSNSICSNLEAFARHSIVARAESENSGGGEVANESDNVEGEVTEILNKRAVEASEKERPIPDIRTGDIVEIKLEVPENRRRLSIYKGIVMSRQNAGITLQLEFGGLSLA